MINLEQLIGQTVDGKYEILEEIGRGAMGIVYRANLKALQKEVAFKVLHKRFSHDAKYVKRFQAEAQIASSLGRHPNVAYVYGSGKVGNLHYIVMEYLPGGELYGLLRGTRRLDVSESVNLFIQACQGLAFIHEKGIVHRDLKPGNLMFGVDGNLNITDFGIAVGGDTDEDKAEKGGPGTPKYMSPEQIKGEPVDVRSDIYSLGIMLYELVTGTIPYPADTVQDLIMKVMTQRPIPVRSANPRISDVLEAAIMRAIEKDKNNRYQSVAEFAGAVAAAVGRDAPDLPDTSKQSFVSGLLWYHWALTALAVAILVSAVFMLFAPAKKPDPNGGQVQTQTGGGEDQPITEVTETTNPGQEVRVLEQKARVSIAKRNLAEATAFLTEALDEYDSKDYNCNLLLGEVLQKRGRIQDSLKQYENLHNLYPEEQEVLARLGQGYMTIEFYLPAITFFEKFLKLKPDDETATLDIGLAYLKWAEEANNEGDKETIIEARTVKGLSSLNKVADKIDLSQRPEVLQHMIKGYVRMGKNKEARDLIQKLPEGRSVSPQIYKSLGLNSLEDQRFQQSVLELREALKKKDASPECWQALGTALIKGRQAGAGDIFFSGDEVLQEAIEALRKAGAAEDKPELLKMLGWAQVEYVKNNEDGVQQAVETCEKLKSLFPDDQVIQEWLPDLYQQSQNLDKLIAIYKEKINKTGVDAKLSGQLAEALLEKARQADDIGAREGFILEAIQYKRLDEAVEMLIQVYQELAEAEPVQLNKLPFLDKILEFRDSPEVRLKAADIHVAAGLKTNELVTKYRHYQKALEYASDHRAAKHNLVVVLWHYFKGGKTSGEKIGWLREIRKIKPKDKQAVTWLLKLLMEKIKTTPDETEKQQLLEEAKSLEVLIGQ